MSLRDPHRVSDGFTDLSGGADSGSNPSVLQPNQCAYAVNITFRGGFASTRPKFMQIVLRFDVDATKNWFESHHVQGGFVYEQNDTTSLIILSVGGRIYKVDPNAKATQHNIFEITPFIFTTTTANFTSPAINASVNITVTSVSGVEIGVPIVVAGKMYLVTAIAGLVLTATNLNQTPAVLFASGTQVSVYDVNPSNRTHAWMEQAEQYLIIQDGQSVALIFDGSTLRRSRTGAPLYEVPTGCMMAYGQKRLSVVRPTRRSYVVGDLVNSGKEVIQFTETNFAAEGGDVFIPIQGLITAMRFIAVLDNSTGQGDLVIHTSKGACSARVGELRTTWKDIPFQRISQLKNGGLSQFSTLVVSGDQFYRSKDGLRSLAFAQRQDQTSWANTPISREANRLLKFDDRKLLDSSQGVLFDNRVLLTVSPTKNAGRIYHRGLLALDFDISSSMTKKMPPAYDLLWTGLNPSKLLVGDFGTEERCFAVHYNDEGKNELWEIMREQGADNDDEENRIACVIEGRSMNHGTPKMLKKLESGDVAVDSLQGQVDFAVQYRPDQYACWFDWHSWSECATVKDCTLTDAGCLPLMNLKPQFRPRMPLPQPPDGCEDGDNKPRRLGYEFQSRIAWIGVAEIKSFYQHAYDQLEQVAGCAPESECRQTECCNINPLGYTLESSDNEVLD